MSTGMPLKIGTTPPISAAVLSFDPRRPATVAVGLRSTPIAAIKPQVDKFDVDVVVMGRSYFGQPQRMAAPQGAFATPPGLRYGTGYTYSALVPWVIEDAKPLLVRISAHGQSVQESAEAVLQRFQREGLISSFDCSSMTTDALVYSVLMPQERWSSENREQLHAAALDLQEQHDVVVLFELRRERVRAERP